jgi:hypothetical protein
MAIHVAKVAAVLGSIPASSGTAELRVGRGTMLDKEFNKNSPLKNNKVNLELPQLTVPLTRLDGGTGKGKGGGKRGRGKGVGGRGRGGMWMRGETQEENLVQILVILP